MVPAWKECISKSNLLFGSLEIILPKALVPEKIQLEVEYENVITYKTVRKNVISAIQNIFTVTPLSLGRSLDIAKVWQAINSVAGVKRFVVLDPTTNITCMPYELIMLPEENLIIKDILNNEAKYE